MTDFEDAFGDPNGEKAERLKAAKLEYEASLADIREAVDTHIRGFEAMGYSRAEALFFGGQLHVFLTTLHAN